ncbi:MAG: class I SAM-dependent methyltransferase [Candidatus Wallbacteria bacterium]|nr:class I SAM-dependent methyltransferase [Candidatus Wallbacteria bacterium]
MNPLRALFELLKKEYNSRYSGWGPEDALRYLPILDALRERGLESGSILDVGSGDRGISPYVRRPVVGCDVSFGLAGGFSLQRVRGFSRALPFRDNAFDVAMSVDALEHIPGADRDASYRELVRVARRLVVVMVPAGRPAARQDRELADFYMRTQKKTHHFLEDHLRNGLPEPEAVLDGLREAARLAGKEIRLAFRMRDNLRIRGWILRTALTPGLASIRKLQLVTVAAPLAYRLIGFGDCYRLLALGDLAAASSAVSQAR